MRGLLLRAVVSSNPSRLAPLFVLVLGGCGLLDSDPEASEIRLSRSAVAFDVVGDTVTLSATVFDTEGVEMVGTGVQWASSDPSVATVTSSGLVTSIGRGSSTLSVTSGSASATANVTVNPTIHVLEIESSDTFTGTAGEPLPDAITIRALDRLGSPIGGAELEARVDLGDGSLDATTLTTNADGRATVRWTLGPVAGSAQQMRIVAPPSFTRFFTATARPGPVEQIRVVEGGRQAGLPGTELVAPLRIRLEDRLGNIRPGVAVELSVIEGGGRLSTSTGVTSDDGVFETRWTLGAASGPQRVRIVHAEGGALDITAQAIAEAAALEVRTPAGAISGTVDELTDLLPRVRLVDAQGAGLAGVPVIFEVPQGSLISADPEGEEGLRVASTTAPDGVATLAGWRLGTTAGPQQLVVRFPGLDPVFLEATATAGAAAAVELVAGNRQAATSGTLLADPLVARVVDAFGNPVAGATIDVVADVGAATLRTSRTDEAGLIELDWQLGDAIGLQTLTLSVASSTLEGYAASTYAPAGDFNINVVFTTDVSPTIWAAFQIAASRWSQVIVDDLPDMTVDQPSNSCGPRSPALRGTIDDLHIWARIEPIDGPFSVLGSAGPCWARESSLLPFVGRMRFDVEDLERIEQQGTLQALILHEIGHVLGIGSLWRAMDLLADPSLDVPGAPDTHFTGPLAIAAFDEVGGADYEGARVPVENIQGGAGTRDAHWRESVFDTELMTGFLDASANPMSPVTIQSLADQGYAVSLETADVYRLPGGASAPARTLLEKLELGDDVWRLPLRFFPEPTQPQTRR